MTAPSLCATTHAALPSVCLRAALCLRVVWVNSVAAVAADSILEFREMSQRHQFLRAHLSFGLCDMQVFLRGTSSRFLGRGNHSLHAERLPPPGHSVGLRAGSAVGRPCLQLWVVVRQTPSAAAARAPPRVEGVSARSTSFLVLGCDCLAGPVCASAVGS